MVFVLFIFINNFIRSHAVDCGNTADSKPRKTCVLLKHELVVLEDGIDLYIENTFIHINVI